MISIAIDGSLIFQIVNFILMIIVLNYLLYKPIRGILKQRQEKIQEFESSIELLTRRVEDRSSEIESSLIQARKDGVSEKEKIKDQGVAEEKAIVDEAGSKAGDALNKIKAQISDEISVARDALRSELDAFAMALAQKILGRSLT